tara:strand:+ start:79 stop:387 length:309 start_codon:yes stop_codon:yes gene_type:complete
MTPENKIKIKVMNLKNTHKEIYQRLSNEDIELFYQVNKGEDALITFDEYWERNDFASAIEEIMLKLYGGKTLLEWRRENDVEDDCTITCSAELDNEWYYESM